MPVDASIYNNLNTTPYNPLKTIGDVTAIQNAMQTGQNLQQQNQLGQIKLSSDQAALASQQYGYINKVMGDLAAKANSRQGITQQEIINAGVNAVADGMIPKSALDNFVQNLPEDTPAANAAYINQTQYKTLESAKQHDAIYGSTGSISNGAGTVIGNIASPMQQAQGQPAFSQGGYIKNALSPGENSTTHDILNDKNEKGIVFNSDVLNPDGTRKTASQQAVNSQGGSSDGDINAPSLSATAAARVPENTVPPIAPVILRTAQAPGAALDMEEQAKQGVALQHIADSVPQRKALLGELESITKSGDVNFGPGSDKWKGILAGAQRLYGGDSETVAKYDTFNKLATQLAQQQFQSLGGTGTDTKLGSAISASPNTSLSNRSNADIIALLKGNEDAIKTKNNEWLKWKKKEGAGSYADFSSDFNNKFDPRVFQGQYMAPKDKAAMLDGLSDSEYAKYKKDYDTAHKSGWLNK